MHKILFLLIVVLLTSFSFGQAPWAYSNTGYVMTNVYTCPDTATLKIMDTAVGNMVYLRGYTSGSSVGEGWFITTTTAISVDATNVIDHKDSGTRFVRMAATWRGSDVFVTTALVDTILISGLTTSSTVIVGGKYVAGVDQQDVLQSQCKADTLIVHRLAAGENVGEYYYIVIK